MNDFVFSGPAPSEDSGGGDFVFDEASAAAKKAAPEAAAPAAEAPTNKAAAPAKAAAPTFAPITKVLEETGSKVFDDPAYYKTAMGASSDEAKRLHAVYQKFATAKDPKDKAVFRQQLINPFWDFLGKVAFDAPGNISAPRKNLLRFAMLNPNALPPEAKAFFSKIIAGPCAEPAVLYMDEWIRKVGSGDVKASTTDEVATRGKDASYFRGLLDRAQGKLDGTKGLLRNLNDRKKECEVELAAKCKEITQHHPSEVFGEIDECYDEGQKGALSGVQELAKGMARFDREIEKLLDTLAGCERDVETIKANLEESGAAESASVDTQAITTEFQSIRQMAKMTIGRQGNAFPFLTGEYFHSIPNAVGFRENIIKLLAWIESVDCEVFQRRYKSQINRIVPYVLLLPTYGDFGVCWEPFDKMNKTTSRGRLAVPMYPKNLTIALLTAVGDFRWQMAKEVASYSWMEEGLTGNYYQWIQAQKIKGDLKMLFVQDYIMWMTKEADGTQKLDKELRGIFWRYMPFSQSLKDKLKDRNMTYLELYQRDKNRMMSDY
jgi:hypothetical protein